MVNLCFWAALAFEVGAALGYNAKAAFLQERRSRRETKKVSWALAY